MTETKIQTSPRTRRGRIARPAVERPRASRRAKATPASATPPTTQAKAGSAAPSDAKSPRPGSRLAALVEMLCRPDGATLAAMSAATSWQAHSVRGAIAGALKKTYGLTITSAAAEGGRVYRIVPGEASA